MSRPKGSKNKKKANNALTITEQVNSAKSSIEVMQAELKEITTEIDEKKKLASAKKKEIRKAETVLKHLIAKEEEANAAATAAAAKAEIEEVVAKLISSGKSKDEILNLLK